MLLQYFSGRTHNRRKNKVSIFIPSRAQLLPQRTTAFHHAPMQKATRAKVGAGHLTYRSCSPVSHCSFLGTQCSGFLTCTATKSQLPTQLQQPMVILPLQLTKNQCWQETSPGLFLLAAQLSPWLMSAFTHKHQTKKPQEKSVLWCRGLSLRCQFPWGTSWSPSCFISGVPGKAMGDGPSSRAHKPTWETHMKFLAPGFSLATATIWKRNQQRKIFFFLSLTSSFK